MPAPRVLGPNGDPYRQAAPRAASERHAVRARFDAAILSDETKNHWANADGLSARAAHDPATRKRLRDRARYEVANNSYASGIVETLSNDAVGTGPRLQLQTDDPDANARTAEAFEEWAEAVGLAEKLRTYRESRTVDGEAFAVMTTNPVLPTPVQLDLRLYEADQVATPTVFVPTPAAVDGIDFDAHGNPAEYHLLKRHPGDTVWSQWGVWDFDRVPASLVLHWFKRRRAGQVRGIGELTPALPLFAMLRRYTLAALSAAEIAALFAVMLKSTMPPDDTTPALPDFDLQEVVRGMMTALPTGYDASQLKAEQPTTTYAGFKDAVLNEIARCLHVPFNVAAGNSSSYNYASGRLDHQVYHRAIGVDRYHLETAVLDRLLRAWLAEARLADPGSVEGLDLTPGTLPRRLPRHQWYWDGFAHVDPAKEATAQETRLRNRTTTLSDEWAEAGYDWRAKARQQAEERKYYATLGVPYPGDAPPALPAPTGDGNADPNAD